MHSPASISIKKFGNDQLHSLLAEASDSRQINYIVCYLKDLGAESVIEEPQYFDRDYLSEFSAFYGVSSKGYPNICKRLHFFSKNIDRSLLRRAVGGNIRSIKQLQESYLGFVVVRPIPASPLGRTVLRWYPDDASNPPRIVAPSRNYISHLSGIELRVHGLAWQQQDSGVGACATIGLWSMLHSSAFDDHHAIPTTAEITRSAHRTASLGSRIFPTSGLNIHQILEAIKENRLAPLILDGEIPPNVSANNGFGRERFATSCASLVRSGYPVLAVGHLGAHGLHAVCITGFREASPPTLNPNDIYFADKNIEHVYVHDDNIGPNVRFKVEDDGVGGAIELMVDPPPETSGNPAVSYPRFRPTQLIAATHEDLRTSPDTLHKVGYKRARLICNWVNRVLGSAGVGFMFSSRFMKLPDYVGEELGRIYGDSEDATILSKVRLGLSERVCPMSLHIGLVRIGFDNNTPLVDILYDTSDSDRNHPVFAHVVFNGAVAAVIDKMLKTVNVNLGTLIQAY